jgi:hypothetical protein
MRTRRISGALAALSIPLLAGGAIAVASAVSSTPGPQVVIPAKTSSVTKTTVDDHRKDTPATSNKKPTTNTHGTTPTTIDDHGGNRGSGHGSDDGPGHS